MAFYMKYGGQGPLAKKSNGALRNKSGLLMSPFAAVDCGDPTPDKPNRRPCGEAGRIVTGKTTERRDGPQGFGDYSTTTSNVENLVGQNKETIPATVIPPSESSSEITTDSKPKKEKKVYKKGTRACDKEYIAKNGNGACTAYKKKKAEKTPEVVKETPKFKITEDSKTEFKPIVVDKDPEPKKEKLSFSVLGGQKNTKRSIGGKVPEVNLSLGIKSGGGGGCPSGRNCRGATNKAK
jgi:hypothetical protein